MGGTAGTCDTSTGAICSAGTKINCARAVMGKGSTTLLLPRCEKSLRIAIPLCFSCPGFLVTQTILTHCPTRPGVKSIKNSRLIFLAQSASSATVLMCNQIECSRKHQFECPYRFLPGQCSQLFVSIWRRPSLRGARPRRSADPDYH